MHACRRVKVIRDLYGELLPLLEVRRIYDSTWGGLSVGRVGLNTLRLVLIFNGSFEYEYEYIQNINQTFPFHHTR